MSHPLFTYFSTYWMLVMLMHSSIDMHIECTTEKLIVGDNPAIINLDFTVNASLLHRHLGCEAAIIRPFSLVQGVPIMVSLCFLNEVLGKPLRTFGVLHAWAARVQQTTRSMDHLF